MATNPFSVTNVQPGTISFVFQNRAEENSLWQRIHQHRGRGVIIGNHGTGKTTLLYDLERKFQIEGLNTRLFRMESRLDRLTWRQIEDSCRLADQLLIDGFEQLSWLHKTRLSQLCRQQNRGLIVTAHRPQRMPRLFETRANAHLAWELVNQFWVRYCRSRFGERSVQPPVTIAQVSSLMRQHHGNIREVLFALYDHFERVIRPSRFWPDSEACPHRIHGTPRCDRPIAAAE